MKTKFLIFTLFGVLIIFGCKKEIEIIDLPGKSNEIKGVDSENLTSREVSLSNQDIYDWLNAQKVVLNNNNNDFITNIIENLDFESKYIESESDEENLIIIPLKEDFISNHLEIGQPLKYLLLKDNQSGDIRRGDIILFYPNDPNVTSLPENSFINYFQQESIAVNGKIIFITLDDIKEFQIQYENGIKTEEEMWTGKADEGNEDCLNWYEVTTIYNSEGEIVSETWVYLYQSCNLNSGGGSGGGSNGGGGGGGNGSNNGTNGSINGSGTQQGTPVSGIVRTYLIGQYIDRYKVDVACTFSGLRYINTALDQFTGMTYTSTRHNNWGVAGASNNIYHSSWNETTNNANYSPTTATANASGLINYVNQNGPGSQFVIQNWANWTAKNVIN